MWADPTLGAFPSRRVAPDPSLIEVAAKLLRKAKQPLFICGGGVVLSGAEAELLARRKLGAPVATTISGKGSIDERAAQAVGVVGSNGGTVETRAIVDAADLIVFVGCRAGSVTTERWRHPAPGSARIIHIDVDPAVPGTNYKVDVPSATRAFAWRHWTKRSMARSAKAISAPWKRGSAKSLPNSRRSRPLRRFTH